MPGASQTITPVQMTKNPFSIPLTTGVKWWWRVRSWRLLATFSDIGTIEFTLGTGGPYGDERDRALAEQTGGASYLNYAWSGTLYASVGEQVRIISARLEYLPPSGVISFEHAPTSPLWGAYALPNAIIEDEPEIPMVDRVFAPTMAFQIYTDPMWDIGTEIVGAAASIPLIIPASGNYSEHDGTIDGIAWRLGWDGGVAMASVTWSLTPATWWTWGGTWNGSTGARL